uniref:Uncharacterized protein LOC114346073 n=2 Tax=Diabrotica virgifera virgifera TaxID=50390 RepID=A0A6P7H2F4_DIAVI
METLSPSKICGRRIVDVCHFSKALLSFPHCGLFSCDGSTVELLKETRKGLESTFLFQCNTCKSTVEVSTDDPYSQQIHIPCRQRFQMNFIINYNNCRHNFGAYQLGECVYSTADAVVEEHTVEEVEELHNL